MKHPLLIGLLLAALPSAGWAQSANPAMWCPPGATWTYGYGEMAGSGTLTVRYVRDTLVAGQAAQLLTRQINICYYLGPGACVPAPAYNISSTVTRVVADRVEIWANGQFYTLYDFAAVPGSSWLTAPVTPQGPCPSGLVQVNVDSVGRQVVAGRSLRWFRAHLTAAAGTNTAGFWSGRIYEQLGVVAQYMQPQSPNCRGTDPGYMGPFVGFRATGWPGIGYNPTTGTLLATAQARAAAAGFAVFPNPASAAAGPTVQLPPAASATARLVLLDAAGRPVREQAARPGQPLDVRGLPAGHYTLLLREVGRPVLAQRLLLE